MRCIYTLKWLVIVVEDLLAHFKMKIDEKKNSRSIFCSKKWKIWNFLAHGKKKEKNPKDWPRPHSCFRFNQSESRNNLEMKQLTENWQHRTPLPLNYPPNDPIKYFSGSFDAFTAVSLSRSLSLTSKSIHFCVRTSWKSSFSSFSLISMMSHREDFFFVIIFVSNQAEPIFLCNFSLLDFLKSFQFSLEA